MLDVIEVMFEPEETIALAFLMSVDRRLVGRLQIYRRLVSFEFRKETLSSVQLPIASGCPTESQTRKHPAGC